MYAIRKSDLKAFRPNPKVVCAINEGSTNAYLRTDRAIEQFLKTIEPSYNASVEKLRENKIDKASIYVISGYMAHVVCCSPAAMRINSEPLRNAAELVAEMLDARGEIPAPPKELEAGSLTELLKTGKLKFEVDPKFPQAIGISNILSHVAVFGNFRWEILSNDFEESAYFTSDFPTAIEPTDDPRVLNRIFPLAPDLTIRVKPNLSIDRKNSDFSFSNFDYRMRRLGYDEVAEINRSIVRCAEEFVFYRDDVRWVKRFIERNSNYRIEPITHRLATDRGTISFFSQKIARIAPAEAVKARSKTREG
jgi:hypothetical protein